MIGDYEKRRTALRSKLYSLTTQSAQTIAERQRSRKKCNVAVRRCSVEPL